MQLQYLLLLPSLPVIATVVLFVLIVLVLLYFWYVYTKEKEFVESEEKTLSAYEKMLKRAHRQAHRIITNASNRASKLLTSTTYIKKQAQQEVEKGVEENAKTTLASYEATIDTIADEATHTLHNTAESMKDMSEKELETYRKTLLDALSVSRENLDMEVTQELEKAKADIENYKKQQMEKIDEKIRERVESLSLAVLGKTFSSEEHTKLIMNALEKAHSDGLFTL